MDLVDIFQYRSRRDTCRLISSRYCYLLYSSYRSRRDFSIGAMHRSAFCPLSPFMVMERKISLEIRRNGRGILRALFCAASCLTKPARYLLIRTVGHIGVMAYIHVVFPVFPVLLWRRFYIFFLGGGRGEFACPTTVRVVYWYIHTPLLITQKHLDGEQEQKEIFLPTRRVSDREYVAWSYTVP